MLNIIKIFRDTPGGFLVKKDTGFNFLNGINKKTGIITILIFGAFTLGKKGNLCFDCEKAVLQET